MNQESPSACGGECQLKYTPNNLEARDRLIHRWTSVLRAMDKSVKHVMPFNLYPRNLLPLGAVAHQCGTCRFGIDSQTSVLDLNCRTHEIDNLYVVDGSFFPSHAGVNPTLTIIANAIRVADHLTERMGGHSAAKSAIANDSEKGVTETY